MNLLHDTFLQLVRLGLGLAESTEIAESDDGLDCVKSAKSTVNVDWKALKTLADAQGLSAIVLDGINEVRSKKPEGRSDWFPPQQFLLQWIGEVMQGEERYAVQRTAAEKMAQLFHDNHIRTYVLKGEVVSECYPRPNHRVSVDLDCFLTEGFKKFNCLSGSSNVLESSSVQGNGRDVWSLGNDLIRKKRCRVDEDFYKNSTFFLPGLMVENHRYLTPFRGNERLKKLEKWFQSQLKANAELSDDSAPIKNSRFGESYLYRPPVMVSALFLIEHAYSHFLHEGLTWRHVLDWQMFTRKHQEEIDWTELDARIDEFGFRKFYDSYSRLGEYIIGEFKEFKSSRSSRNSRGSRGSRGSSSLSVPDRRMLEDIWNPLDLHETVVGVKGKLALAGNTWRARWKYRYFTDINWMQALWIQVRGFLFERDVRLESLELRV